VLLQKFGIVGLLIDQSLLCVYDAPVTPFHCLPDQEPGGDQDGKERKGVWNWSTEYCVYLFAHVRRSHASHEQRAYETKSKQQTTRPDQHERFSVGDTEVLEVVLQEQSRHQLTLATSRSAFARKNICQSRMNCRPTMRKEKCS
jgi:hypothetical protein